MFDRKKYKAFAKSQLGDRIGTGIGLEATIFGIELFFSMICSTIFAGWLLIQIPILETELLNDESYIFFFLFKYFATMFPFALILVFVHIILRFATNYLYLDLSYSPKPVSLVKFFVSLKYSFRGILVALWKFLWFFLWYLLLIIPGFIKYYSYYFIELIAAENKNLSVRESMNVSKIITKGHKWDLFVLDLSFIGWALLVALIPTGIGIIFLCPYYSMTRINAYHDILQEAIEDGNIPEEYLRKMSFVKPVDGKPTIDYQDKLEDNSQEETTSTENNDSTEKETPDSDNSENE